MSTPPRNYSLRELAKRIGYDTATTAQMLKEGKGPGYKVGGRYISREDWVERWERGEIGFWAVAIAGLHHVEEEPESIAIRRLG